MLKLKAKTRGFQRIIQQANRRISALQDIDRRALERFGAIIRQDARKLIGNPVKPQKQIRTEVIDGKPVAVYQKGRKPRPPGKPPMARYGDRDFGIRKIVYEVNLGKRDVKIGFAGWSRKLGSKWGAELHEFGGTFTAKVRYIPALITLQNIKRRKGKTTIAHQDLALISSKTGRPMNFKMPKRPTMAPALARHRNKMTKIWVDYYKARFG
jgi:hypothetical protein